MTVASASTTVQMQVSIAALSTCPHTKTAPVHHTSSLGSDDTVGKSLHKRRE
jgi:hypothetical protein